MKMMEQKSKIPDYVLVSVCLLVFLVFYIVEGLPFTDSFVIGYLMFTLFRFLNNLGHTINLLDFLTFYSALDTLASPLITYRYYGIDYEPARLWGSYMRVPEDIYFSYLIPANLAFFGGLHLVFKKSVQNAREYVEKAKAYVSGNLKVGIAFVVIGLASSQFKSMVPASIGFVFYLLSMLPYVGGFYLYFSLKKRRGLIMSLLIAIFFLQSVRSGLFGECVMFCVMAGCLIATQVRLGFMTKLFIFSACFGLVLLIQSVKGQYRILTWTNAIETKGQLSQYANKSTLEIFADLALDKLSNPSEIITLNSGFSLNQRFNQGRLIALAMNYVPRVEPYADGETIWKSLAAVVVPRFLWPDKPESGGAYNLSRFVGIKRHLTYSMNIGPYGEGYGNFGVAGGVVFMFLYGMLIAFFLHKVLEKSRRYPSLIIWVPLLFYYVLTVETDILSTINAFVKIIVFMCIVYWICKKAYRIDI